MTLGEGKNKVYMLLDEHSAGGEVEHDEDIEKKMVWFFDTAQKQLASIRRIVKIKRLRPERGRMEYAMPSDFRSLYRVWRQGRVVTSRYGWRGGKILIPDADPGTEILVEYFANPATIPEDAGDDYEFELAEDACECMPFYVAAQQLLPDLVMDYGAMLRMYELAVSRLSVELPGENARINQRLYRG